MLTRHMNEIYLRLEAILNASHSQISGDELRRWYNQERLTKKVWRDLSDKWEEICDDSPMLIAQHYDNYVLIYGRGLSENGATSQDAWFSDIKEWI